MRRDCRGRFPAIPEPVRKIASRSKHVRMVRAEYPTFVSNELSECRNGAR